MPVTEDKTRLQLPEERDELRELLWRDVDAEELQVVHASRERFLLVSRVAPVTVQRLHRAILGAKSEMNKSWGISKQWEKEQV